MQRGKSWTGPEQREAKDKIKETAPNVAKWQTSLRQSAGDPSRTSNSLEKTGSGTLNRSSKVWNNVENEFIRNLQQQIYFLELENKHLRDQVKKAGELHPKMVDEAATMLDRLRDMEGDMKQLEAELSRSKRRADSLAEDKRLMEAARKEEKKREARVKETLADEMRELRVTLDACERDRTLLSEKCDLLERAGERQNRVSEAETTRWSEEVVDLTQQNRLLRSETESLNEDAEKRNIRIEELEDQLNTVSNISRLASSMGRREPTSRSDHIYHEGQRELNKSLNLTKSLRIDEAKQKQSLSHSRDTTLYDHVNHLEKSSRKKELEIATLRGRLADLEETDALKRELQRLVDDTDN